MIDAVLTKQNNIPNPSTKYQGYECVIDIIGPEAQVPAPSLVHKSIGAQPSTLHDRLRSLPVYFGPASLVIQGVNSRVVLSNLVMERLIVASLKTGFVVLNNCSFKKSDITTESAGVFIDFRKLVPQR